MTLLSSVCLCLFPKVWEAANVLIKAAVPLTTSDTKTVSEWTRQMATLPQASNLATRILLLTLLFEVHGLAHSAAHIITVYLYTVLLKELMDLHAQVNTPTVPL